jgi:hypothetical protein
MSCPDGIKLAGPNVLPARRNPSHGIQCGVFDAGDRVCSGLAKVAETNRLARVLALADLARLDLDGRRAHAKILS